MAEAWRLILLLIPLLAGGISIFFAFRLMKRYKLGFTSSYFYYLVFLYIFGTYSLAGTGILELLLTRMEIDQQVMHSSRLYAVFLGIPFLALSKFMFIRSITEFFQKKPATVFIVFYFLSLTVIFLLNGIYMVRLTHFDLGSYRDMLLAQRFAFIAFIWGTYLISYLYILFFSTSLSDLHAKRHIRTFGAWYLVYMVLCITPLILTSHHQVFRQVFLLVFLSWHLIPILFLNIYLNKYQEPESSLPEDFETRLLAFVEQHDISKRESEVVRLICRGLSNQEISDTLFISLQTVKDHIHRIFIKTGVRNRVQLSNMIR
ncbi:MAG: helix-turn-helix transcriptional regulator [Eudoraea sp.]|nr:helix-turn-helix transcriptional regulator [Eudoraea sp.]